MGKTWKSWITRFMPRIHQRAVNLTTDRANEGPAAAIWDIWQTSLWPLLLWQLGISPQKKGLVVVSMPIGGGRRITRSRPAWITPLVIAKWHTWVKVIASKSDDQIQSLETGSWKKRTNFVLWLLHYWAPVMQSVSVWYLRDLYTNAMVDICLCISPPYKGRL